MIRFNRQFFRKLAFASLALAYLLFAASVVVSQEKNAVRIIQGKSNTPPKQVHNPNQIGRIIVADKVDDTKKKTPKQSTGQVYEMPVIKKFDHSQFRKVPTQNPRKGQSQVPVGNKSNNTKTQKLIDRMIEKSSDSQSRQKARNAQRSPVRQIADLPSVNNIDQNGTGINPAAFYPATQDQNPVAVPESQPQNQDKMEQIEKPKTQTGGDSKFSNRGEFNMLKPVMPRPVIIPGEQGRHIDPRREAILSSGEYLHDGGDRKLQTVVGGDWSVKGLDPEDTIGHFDTLSGDRKVVPSNRVSIYAPRFAAVRKVDGLISADGIERTIKSSKTSITFKSAGSDFATTTKQHVAAEKNVGRKSASALIDRTRGIVVDNTTITRIIGNHISPTKVHNFLLTGYANNTEKPFIAAAIQAAKVWSADVEAQAVVKNNQIAIVHDFKKAQDVTHIDAGGKKAQLRVIKMASKRAAQPGDIIEFMIRFDNVGSELIGNVTIIDNLTARLEYIEGSATCNVKADLITSNNDVGSLKLRWEVVDPIKIGKGGVIRFKCRVR